MYMYYIYKYILYVYIYIYLLLSHFVNALETHFFCKHLLTVISVEDITETFLRRIY